MWKRNFVVRAEPSSEGETGATDDAQVNEAAGSGEASVAVVESEAEAEAVLESEPEEPKPPRKSRVKLGDIMGILNKRAVEAAEHERPVPDIRTGDVVQIKLEVPENKRRLSIYKGIVISRQNAGIHTTIRIRRIIAGIGVEIVFPLYSPNIKELKVLSHRKVRRARFHFRSFVPYNQTRSAALPHRALISHPTVCVEFRPATAYHHTEPSSLTLHHHDLSLSGGGEPPFLCTASLNLPLLVLYSVFRSRHGRSSESIRTYLGIRSPNGLQDKIKLVGGHSLYPVH
ncbi:unnamed protein product [Malus baccata var. baccata]